MKQKNRSLFGLLGVALALFTAQSTHAQTNNTFYYYNTSLAPSLVISETGDFVPVTDLLGGNIYFYNRHADDKKAISATGEVVTAKYRAERRSNKYQVNGQGGSVILIDTPPFPASGVDITHSQVFYYVPSINPAIAYDADGGTHMATPQANGSVLIDNIPSNVAIIGTPPIPEVTEALDVNVLQASSINYEAALGNAVDQGISDEEFSAFLEMAKEEEAEPVVLTEAQLAEQAARVGYNDVPLGHPNMNAIAYAKIQNYMTGYPDGSFGPENNMNRAEISKSLIGATYSFQEIQTCEGDTFTDIPSDEWYKKYVCVAKRDGLLSGFPDGTFRAADTVNVAQAMKLVAIANGLAPTEAAIWYQPYAEFLAEKNALPLTLPLAHEAISRAHVAEMIYRVNLTDTKAASNDNIQAETDFIVSLTAKQILNGTRPFAHVPAGEPVRHMNCEDSYFDEKLNHEMVLDMQHRINTARAASGAAPVELDARLACRAQIHTDRMARYQFLSHDTPGGDTARSRTDASGFQYVYYGENIVRGAYTPERAMYKWSHSPKHWANTLDPVHTHIGPGWAVDEELGGFYWTIIFAQEFREDETTAFRSNDTAGPAEGADTIEYTEFEANTGPLAGQPVE